MSFFKSEQWHIFPYENTYRSSSRSWPGGHLLLTQWEACWDGRLPSLRLDRDPETRARERKTFIQANNKIHSTPISTKKTTTTTFLPPEHVSLQHQTPQTGRHQRCRAPLCPQHPETSSSFSDLEATFIVRHTQGTRYKLHRNTHIPGREKRGTTLKLLLKDAWCETANTQTFCWAAKHSLVLENTNTTYVLH